MPKPPPPPRPDTDRVLAAVGEWRRVIAEKEDLAERERALRLFIIKQSFATLEEGTNTCERGAFRIKVTQKFSRKIDPAQLGEGLRARLAKVGAKLDLLVRYEPELVLPEYRRLQPEQRKVMDAAITMKEGLPSLDVTEAT